MAQELGFVATVMGRRRYLPEIRSRNFAIREFAKRTAINSPIQGTAADLIKRAMIEIGEALRGDEGKRGAATNGGPAGESSVTAEQPSGSAGKGVARGAAGAHGALLAQQDDPAGPRRARLRSARSRGRVADPHGSRPDGRGHPPRRSVVVDVGVGRTMVRGKGVSFSLAVSRRHLRKELRCRTSRDSCVTGQSPQVPRSLF